MTGRLIRSISGFYTVRTDTGDIVCRARGIFRKQGITPLTGDFVTVELSPDGTGTVTAIAERKNELIRPQVSNIDVLVTLISEAVPRTDPYVIDQMTAAAAYRNIDVVLIINKCDLSPGDTLANIYRTAGFPVFQVSAFTGDGVGTLWPVIEGKCIALAGNSGVGKSKLINALYRERGQHTGSPVQDGQNGPAGPCLTGEVSERLGRGRHTTRHVELFELPHGVLAADTPGFGAVDEPQRIPKAELAGCFIDFRPYLGGCRFTGCLHGDGQKACTVRAAAADGLIHPSRYGNYLRILSES